jgi:hypothetical protein
MQEKINFLFRTLIVQNPDESRKDALSNAHFIQPVFKHKGQPDVVLPLK